MGQASQNADVLSSPENIKLFDNILKSNVSACTSIGPFFLPQIARIFLDMLGLYKAVSTIISTTTAAEGKSGFRTVEKQFMIPCRSHRCPNPKSPPITNGQERHFETDSRPISHPEEAAQMFGSRHPSRPPFGCMSPSVSKCLS